jgi:GT2 family glycosyltransferase
MHEKEPGCSVILATRGRAAMALEAVRSILAGAELPDEIIIVDQSDQGDAAMAALRSERCAIRYHWSGERGLSRGNNEGVRLARHEVLVFTHDDVVVRREWLGTLVRALVKGGHRTVVTGRVLPHATHVAGAFALTLKTDADPAIYEGRVGEDVLFPLNMAVWRDTLREIGPFDTRLGPGTAFPAAEDNDLGYRLLEAGYRIVYVPEAIVEHRLWRTDRVRLRWKYGLGQGAYYAKYFSLRDRYMLRRFVRHAGRYARRAMRNGARLDPIAISEAAAFAGVVSGAIGWALFGRRRSTR